MRSLDPVRPDGRVLRLPDPPVPGAPAGQWWPSPVLTPAWLREHAAEVDAVHVHFGFEHLTAADLADLLATLDELGLPLVLTVHDLDNPHLRDQAPHRAALDAMVPAAAAVLTLTPGAAARIAHRWGVVATVVPHPHVVPLARLAVPRPPREGFAVALHDKARAGNDPDAVREELRSAVAALPGGRVVASPARRLTDDELWDHLSGLDVLVLAYRTGTHSGFLEACHDLGTTVVAPRTGHYAEQHEVVSYDLDLPGSLTAALQAAFDGRSCAAADPVVRAAQRDAVADAHAALYARVVA